MRWLWMLVLVAGCVTDGTPIGEAMDPLPMYGEWWQQVEDCSGVTGRFEAVRWRVVEGEFMTWNGQKVAGVWDGQRTIYLASVFVDAPEVVRHEMLHALLRQGSHFSPAWEACHDLFSGPIPHSSSTRLKAPA
jgi:hypothetical protein